MGQLAGVGLAVLAAVALATQSLVVRLGTTSHRITDVLAVVAAVNVVVLIPVAMASPAPTMGLTLSAVGAFALAGLLGSLLGRACYFVGIARLGSSRTEPIKALLPLVAVGGAVLILGEPATLPTVVGVGLLVLGGVAVAAEAKASPLTATGRAFWVDLAFPLSAAVLYGIDPIFTKIGFAGGASSVVGVAIRAGAAAGGLGLYLLWRASRGGSLRAGSTDPWLVAAGLANTVYLLAYYAAMARAPVALVTSVLGSSTLFVVGGAALFVQKIERVTLRLAAGAALVVLGIGVVVHG